jgi:hypothetical protein
MSKTVIPFPAQGTARNRWQRAWTYVRAQRSPSPPPGAVYVAAHTALRERQFAAHMAKLQQQIAQAQ